MTADIYWIADAAPGRLAILGRPRPGEWLADEIADWAAAGLTDVVSLLEDFEVREAGLLEEAGLTRQVGISLERFPIPGRGVPASIDATRRLWTPSCRENSKWSCSWDSLPRQYRPRRHDRDWGSS
jgi:hypothetical protein